MFETVFTKLCLVSYIWSSFFFVMVTVYFPQRNILLVQSLVAHPDFDLALLFSYFISNASWQSFLGGTITFSVENPPDGREQCLVEAFPASQILGSKLYLKSKCLKW